MNLYHLQYFVKLAQIQNYTKTAEELSLTQPALSHAIKVLQDELGVQLFEKRGRYVVLTQCGKLYYEKVSQILSSLEEANKQMKKIAKGDGEIRIAFLRNMGIHYIPQIIQSFQLENSENNISFQLTNDSGLSADLLKGLKEEKYDIVFCSAMHKEEGYTYVPIIKQELYIAVGRHHRFYHKKSLALEEIVDEPFIMFSKKSGLRYDIDYLFHKIDDYPHHIIYEIEEDEAIAGFVENDFGIAILPDLKIKDQMQIHLIPISYPRCYRQFYMIIKNNIYHSVAFQKFFEFVKKKASVSSNI